MNHGTIRLEDPVFADHDDVASDPVPGEIDLRAATAPENGSSSDLDPAPKFESEPDYRSLLAAPPPPPPFAKKATSADGQVTLGSLAFRLFDTIENQIARDPHAATLTAMSGRLDVLERSVAAAAGHADALVGLTERLDEIDRQMAAPDPNELAINEINDRLAAVEHRLAAPHPHSGTIKSLVERVDEMETKGSPRNITALAERLDMVERHTPHPDVITQMTDRVVAMERRLTAPEMIAGMAERLQEHESRLAMIEKPDTRSESSKRLFTLIVFLAVAVAVVTTVMLMIG